MRFVVGLTRSDFVCRHLGWTNLDGIHSKPTNQPQTRKRTWQLRNRFGTRSPSRLSRHWRREAASRRGVSRGWGPRTRGDLPTSPAANPIGESIRCCWPSINIGTSFVPAATARLSNGKTRREDHSAAHDIPPGAWGCGIIYYCPITKTITDPMTGEESEENYPLLKTYGVFSVDQVEGDHLDHLRAKDDGPVNTGLHRLRSRGAGDCSNGSRYSFRRRQSLLSAGPRLYPSAAENQVPERGRFLFATAFHELGHWSEKADRMEGRLRQERIKGRNYCSLLLAELGVPQSEALTDHHSYVQNWLKSLRNDNRFIFRASTAANKAADFILFSPVSLNPNWLKCRSKVGGGRVTARGGGSSSPPRADFLDRLLSS